MRPSDAAYVVYATTDDERKAREIAENLWPRKALVRSVNEMHRFGEPHAPRTTDRWAVIAEPKR